MSDSVHSSGVQLFLPTNDGSAEGMCICRYILFVSIRESNLRYKKGRPSSAE